VESRKLLAERYGFGFSNQAFNARIRLACQGAGVPGISAHPPGHAAETLLLNEREANLCDMEALLGHKEPGKDPPLHAR
jgi:integrase